MPVGRGVMVVKTERFDMVVLVFASFPFAWQGMRLNVTMMEMSTKRKSERVENVWKDENRFR